jgi:hypothetical protein
LLSHEQQPADVSCRPLEIDIAAVRARQRAKEPDGRLIGVGLSIYREQAAHGISVYEGWGIPMVPGHEQANPPRSPTSTASTSPDERQGEACWRGAN